MRTAFTVFLTGLLLVSASLSARNGGDAEMAGIWLRRAVELLESSETNRQKYSEAQDALNMAAGFQAPGSDALYLQAFIMARASGMPAGLPPGISAGLQPGVPTGSPVRQAYVLAGEALDLAAGGSLVPFSKKALLWSSLALRLRDYRALLSRYEQWPRGNRYEPALLYAAARAALYLGFEEKAASLARSGESLASHKDGLEELSSAFSGSAVARFRALAVAAGDRESLETLGAARRWGQALEEALMPWVLSGFIGMEAAPYFEDTRIGRVLDVRKASALVRDGDVLRQASGNAVSVPEFLRDDLAFMRRTAPGLPVTAGFFGTLVADRDYDGYAEETVRYVNGRIHERHLDEDQDGVDEWIILFDNSMPIQAVLDGGAVTVNYAAGAYPEVLSMRRKSREASFEASFRPGAYTWEPFDAGQWLSPPRRPSRDEERFWRGVKTVRVQQDFPEDRRMVRAVSRLVDGFVLFAREECFTRPEGSTFVPEWWKSAEPVWVREILYEDGLAVAGRRSFRVDSGERIWELYERYEKGELVGLAWDPGMRGSPVYLHDWALSRYLETRVWNLDRDEWMDARRFTFLDGSHSSRELMVTEASLEDLLPWRAGDWAPWE